MLLVLSLPLSASAATIGAGDTFSLSANKVVTENLYAGGGTLFLSGDMKADATVAGGTVTITGTVEEDLLAAGGTLMLMGDVKEDMRVIGGTVTIGSDVIEGELIAAGGYIHILPNVTVTGDLILAGGSVIMDGTVLGDVELAGGEARIGGTIMGDTIIYSENAAIVPSASLEGSLTYHSTKSAVIAKDTVKGHVAKMAPVSHPNFGFNFDEEAFLSSMIGLAFTIAIMKIIALLVTATLLVTWFNKPSTALARTAMKKPWTEFAKGLTLIVVSPIMLMLLFFSVVGSWLAAFGWVAVGGLTMIAAPYTGIILGGWIVHLVKKKPITTTWQSALLGMLLIPILMMIPILGWLVILFFYCVTVGGLVTAVHKHIMSLR